jgi:hypothetical protein
MKADTDTIDKPPRLPLITGSAALRRRDDLETYFVHRAPECLRAGVSTVLTWITGLAPSADATGATGRASETRAFLLTLAAMFLGWAGFAVNGSWPLALAAGVLLVQGMRSFSSAVGHHMTHGAKVLPLSSEARRLVYDIISALLWLPGFLEYATGHRAHHRYTAGANDEDRRFIAYLGARFDRPWRLLLTLLDPALHARFLGARLRSAFRRGPWWRRLTASLAVSPIIAAQELPMFALWLIFAVFAYQSVTILQWSTEHLWGRRPEGRPVTPLTAGVTYGRLLLPATTAPLDRPVLLATAAMFARLLMYGVVRFILLPGDLANHDLHHLGRGPWLRAAHTRAQLLKQGDIPLYQTASLRGMFTLAYCSATSTPPTPLGEISSDRLLQM